MSPVDYSLFAFPKGAIKVEVKREKRLTAEDRERDCRAEVWARYGRRCEVPGCKTPKDGIEQHHIVYRSRSKALRWAPENRAVLCKTHHQLHHAGKIEIKPRKADGELVIIGPRKYLAFRV